MTPDGTRDEYVNRKLSENVEHKGRHAITVHLVE